MRDRLFANQKTFEPWTAHAESLNLDVAQFEVCLSSGKHADAVRRDMAEASKATQAPQEVPPFCRRRTNETVDLSEIVTEEARRLGDQECRSVSPSSNRQLLAGQSDCRHTKGNAVTGDEGMERIGSRVR